MSPSHAPPAPTGHLVGMLGEFADLSVVRLRCDIESLDGRLPKNSAGTVVGRYVGGVGYEVEFNTPFHTVATVAAHDLEQ